MTTHSKNQDRRPADSAGRPAGPCAGNEAHASGGHGSALQDRVTLTLEQAPSDRQPPLARHLLLRLGPGVCLGGVDVPNGVEATAKCQGYPVDSG
jgi:hypothetical protein